MTAVPLALFARPPVAGRTKTRLIPALGGVGAARLYEAFLRDTIAAAKRATGTTPQLWWSNPPAVEHGYALPERVQAVGHLGARLTHSFEEMDCGSCGAIAIGTDAPTLPVEVVISARRALEHADVVLGPSADGGYYLVGCRIDPAPLFDNVRWSTRHALADTWGNAQREGHLVHQLPPWYDVDTPEGLRLLRTHLAIQPEAAPHTSSWLFGSNQSRTKDVRADGFLNANSR